jgi:hypothetical protein
MHITGAVLSSLPDGQTVQMRVTACLGALRFHVFGPAF